VFIALLYVEYYLSQCSKDIYILFLKIKLHLYYNENDCF